MLSDTDRRLQSSDSARTLAAHEKASLVREEGVPQGNGWKTERATPALRPATVNRMLGALRPSPKTTTNDPRDGRIYPVPG